MVTSIEQMQLETTISELEDDITSLSLSSATSLIDSWREMLLQTGRTDLEAIARDLDLLKSELKGERDNKKIARYMRRMGEHTRIIAIGSSREVSDSLKKLGILLVNASKVVDR